MDLEGCRGRGNKEVMHVGIGSGEGRVSTKSKSIKEGEGNINIVSVVGRIQSPV